MISDKLPFTGNGETILVIDGDQLMRELLLEILTLNGYKVRIARDVVRARHIYEKNPEQINVLLTDIWLSGLGAMLSEVLIASPDKSIVLTTHKATRRNYYPQVGLSVLTKPFDVVELFRAIRVALCSSSNGRYNTTLH